MRVNQDPVQKEAHELLSEWAQGPKERPPMEQSNERVDGGERPASEPERYVEAQGTFLSMDRAVRHVHRMDYRLGGALWAHYAERLDDREASERESMSVRHWRDRLVTARAAFLSAYKMGGAVY